MQKVLKINNTFKEDNELVELVEEANFFQKKIPIIVEEIFSEKDSGSFFSSKLSDEEFFFSGELLLEAKKKRQQIRKKSKKGSKKQKEQTKESRYEEGFMDESIFMENFGSPDNMPNESDDWFSFQAAGVKIGKIEDQQDLCEDAFFINSRAVGVSDGVGSWQKYGMTASAFANELMNNCNSVIEDMVKQKVFEAKQFMRIHRKNSSQNCGYPYLEKSKHLSDCSSYLSSRQQSIK